MSFSNQTNDGTYPPQAQDNPHSEAIRNTLLAIGRRLLTQDNQCTAEPMFCLQIKVRDAGYDSAYSDKRCWYNAQETETIYDDDPDFKEPEGDEWEEFGYVDRWETILVAFTAQGIDDYMLQDGHNVKRRAHNGETRIYVESFRRCDEMIAIRKWLMDEAKKAEGQ